MELSWKLDASRRHILKTIRRQKLQRLPKCITLETSMLMYSLLKVQLDVCESVIESWTRRPQPSIKQFIPTQREQKIKAGEILPVGIDLWPYRII
jgi:hypothetical protein